MTLTRWFTGDTHPERVGVYQRNFGREKKYCYWDGMHWRLGASTTRLAELEEDISSVQLQIPSVVWRGLSEEPKREMSQVPEGGEKPGIGKPTGPGNGMEAPVL